MKIERFIRRPYDVNVVQVTPENANEIAEWCGGTVVQGDYKHNQFTIKLPVVKVPGNGPNKDRTIDARIGWFVVEFNGLFRVYREKQLREDFLKPDSNPVYFSPGDLVQDEDGDQGEVVKVEQILVEVPSLGHVLYSREELTQIREYSDKTMELIKEEARVAAMDPGLDKINALREEAERYVMSGSLNEVLSEAFEESQVIESIGDIKIGTDVVISDQMNDFFSQVGTVESFVNDNCILVKMEMRYGQKEPEIVTHLVREVQICDQVKWVLVHSDVSPQQGWVGWVVQAGSPGETVTVAFRPANFMDGNRDKCFSYMHYELEELDSQPETIPVYEI